MVLKISRISQISSPTHLVSLTVIMQILHRITHDLPAGALLAVGGLRAITVQIDVRRFQIVDLFGARTGTVLSTSYR